jgi:hypothetical protein
MVSRTSTGWEAKIPEVPETLKARSLVTLDRRVRKQLGDQALTYEFSTGHDELDRLVRRLRNTRAAVQRSERRSRLLLDRVILLQADLSQRDVGILVGLSHQRVYQLRMRQRELLGERRKPEYEPEAHAPAL